MPVRAEDNPRMPDMAVGLYHKFCAFDHDKGKSWFMVLATDDVTAQAHFSAFKDLMVAPPLPPAMNDFSPAWQPHETPEGYRAKVQRVIDYIHAGDIFQANLSQQFIADVPADFEPFTHYCTLRAVNPAPFAAYMNFGDVKIASASPERFLFVRGHHVETRPIKGTRPRRADP
ncbi:MAG: chorismate-binding protein, partial [Alphaproteobacteria bacterium]|nr:chorismate-binding protein [Alphaproteobacteria bacterium]